MDTRTYTHSKMLTHLSWITGTLNKPSRSNLSSLSHLQPVSYRNTWTYIHLKMLTHSSSLTRRFRNKKPCRSEQLLTLLFIFKKNNNTKVIVGHSMIIDSNYALLIFPTSMNWSHFSQNTSSRHVYLKVPFEFSSNAAKITCPQYTIKYTLKY